MLCRYCKKHDYVIGNSRKLTHQNCQSSSNSANNSSNQYKKTVACVQRKDRQAQADMRSEISGMSGQPESRGA